MMSAYRRDEVPPEAVEMVDGFALTLVIPDEAWPPGALRLIDKHTRIGGIAIFPRPTDRAQLSRHCPQSISMFEQGQCGMSLSEDVHERPGGCSSG
jgi:hypothetical protein